MKPVRLLPIVVFATSALLVLKAVGLLTQGGYVLLGTSLAQAQTQAPNQAPTQAAPAVPGAGTGAAAGPNGGLPNLANPTNPAGTGNGAQAGVAGAATGNNGTGTNAAGQQGLSPADAAAANRASQALFANPPAQGNGSAPADGVPYTKSKTGEQFPLRSSDGVGDTERAVLERLSERRIALDKQAQALDARQALIDAAEKRLNERIDALKALEARVSQLVDEKKALDDKQFAGLVSMYESMKSKDAAAIFDQLSMDVLLRVVSAMSPRKMAPVLAAMSPEKAQQLTVQMANKDAKGEFSATPADLANLPQIVGK